MYFQSAMSRGLLAGSLFAASAVIRVPKNEQSQAEEYIKSSESQWAEAEVNLDYRIAERILADDFVGVAPDGSHYAKAGEAAPH
jgi:hypothetical protein